MGRTIEMDIQNTGYQRPDGSQPGTAIWTGPEGLPGGPARRPVRRQRRLMTWEKPIRDDTESA